MSDCNKPYVVIRVDGNSRICGVGSRTSSLNIIRIDEYPDPLHLINEFFHLDLSDVPHETIVDFAINLVKKIVSLIIPENYSGVIRQRVYELLDHIKSNARLITRVYVCTNGCVLSGSSCLYYVFLSSDDGNYAISVYSYNAYTPTHHVDIRSGNRCISIEINDDYCNCRFSLGEMNESYGFYYNRHDVERLRQMDDVITREALCLLKALFSLKTIKPLRGILHA